MSSKPSRRMLLARLGTSVSAGLAGCSTMLTDAENSDTPTESPESPTSQPSPTETDSPVASVTVSQTESNYARLGATDASKTATLYGGWKCPYTKQFVGEMLPSIIREYVQPGDLAIEFRAVRFQIGEAHGDDEPRANRAGLAVWHEAPERFPAYFERLFARQPPETQAWATAEQLLTIVRAAGIGEPNPIEQAINDGSYNELWQRSQALVEEKGSLVFLDLSLMGQSPHRRLHRRRQTSSSHRRSNNSLFRL